MYNDYKIEPKEYGKIW